MSNLNRCISFVRREEVAQHKINQKILATEVRLVLEGQEPLLVTTLKAIDMAAEEGLDLVEIYQKDSVILKRESKRILELTKFTIRKRLISEILSSK